MAPTPHVEAGAAPSSGRATPPLQALALVPLGAGSVTFVSLIAASSSGPPNSAALITSVSVGAEQRQLRRL
jgi:hypothetical protein